MMITYSKKATIYKVNQIINRVINRVINKVINRAINRVILITYKSIFAVRPTLGSPHKLLKSLHNELNSVIG